LARFFAAAAETPLRSSINSTFSPAVKVGNRQKRTEPLFRQGFEGCHRLGHETLRVENNEDERRCRSPVSSYPFFTGLKGT
jgi:hypothetical protein